MYLVLTIISICVFGAWLKYRWIHRPQPDPEKTVALTDVEGPRPWGSHVHQSGVRWLHEIFERSAKIFPSLPALTVHATGHTLTYAQLDARAEQIADLIAPTLSHKDQVVAVYMTQDHPDIVAAHLGILKAGGVQLFLDPESPRTVIMDMLRDAQPALLLTRGDSPSFDIPSIDLVSPHAFNDQSDQKKTPINLAG
jgi:non-ribosomal peptide synthetase component F